MGIFDIASYCIAYTEIWWRIWHLLEYPGIDFFVYFLLKIFSQNQLFYIIPNFFERNGSHMLGIQKIWKIWKMYSPEKTGSGNFLAISCLIHFFPNKSKYIFLKIEINNYIRMYLRNVREHRWGSNLSPDPCAYYSNVTA